MGATDIENVTVLCAPEITLGLIPGGSGTQRLTRIIGEGCAKELIFRGEQISAEEFVGDLADGPKTALKVAKRVIDDEQDASLQAGLDAENQAFGLLTTTEDMVEGVTAFRDDREPEFE